jgi:hypothetical protein
MKKYRINYNTIDLLHDKPSIDLQTIYLGLDGDEDRHLLEGFRFYVEDYQLILTEIRYFEDIPMWEWGGKGEWRPKFLYGFTLFTNSATTYIPAEKLKVGEYLNRPLQPLVIDFF